MKDSQVIENAHAAEGSIVVGEPAYKPAKLLSANNIIVFVLTMGAVILFLTLSAHKETSGLYAAIKDFTYYYRSYPFVMVLIPFIAALIGVYVGRRHENIMNAISINAVFITFIMILTMYPQAIEQKIIYNMPRVLGYGLQFRIDMISLYMLMVSSFLWLIGTMYAPYFMVLERHRNRFYMFMSITYSAILGTVMAGDLFTFFLFFEIMTFSSYMLVVHSETEKAIVAADRYIYMGVLGGLSILLGIILLFINTNTLEFSALAAELHNLGMVKYLIAGLFILGFGVKAGMFPLHVWMPNVYEESPIPVNAISSGVMIKIGVYGILRLLTSIYMPDAASLEHYGDAIWTAFQNTGAVIIWLGIVTMAAGVFMALQQGNIKRMLAYSSISQMGYIIMGIGVAAYLGEKGAMGFTGSLYHMLNHSLFKALLFLVAGAVYMRTREFDMYKLGGLWRKMPFTALLCLIAALGITGMPLFNGFASKSMLHHAIVEAYKYGDASFKYADYVFIIASMGTAAYFIKFFGLTFLKKCPPEKYKNIKGDHWIMCMIMSALAVLIVAIGLRPDYILDNFLIPAMDGLKYDSEFIKKYIMDMNFFNAKNLKGMIWPYAGGVIIFIGGMKYHLFNIRLPHWLRVEYIVFYPFYKLADFIEKKILKDQPEGASKSKTLVDGVSCAITVFTEEYEASINRSEDVVSRFKHFVSCIINKCENPIIKSDVIIYTVILTCVLVALILFG